MQIFAKINETDDPKRCDPLFFALFQKEKKKLVLLENRSKSTFQSMKVCSEWVCLEASWVNVECLCALI